MKYSSTSIAILFLIMISCTSKQDANNTLKDKDSTLKERDIILIDTIENNLLPAILVEGEKVEGMNLRKRMEHYKVPGMSIAFLNRGEIVWARGYGYTSVDSTRLVNENTLFQAASISKPVAAMAALALVEEGKLDLDANVNLYLEGWQLEENQFTTDEKVTLRRILSHSAGLTVHGFGGYASGDEVPDIIQILDGEEPANSGRIYPDTRPGKQYRYSGGGYTLMQKMLCDITGKDFPALMEELVLSKIGMNSSSYEQPLPEALWANASSGHLGNGVMIEGRWHTYPEMAAAGLWTTPSDLLKYAMEVQESFAGESNLVLSQEMTKEMLTAQINSHGLGPALGGSGDSITFFHGGSNAGFRCSLYAFSKLGQGVAIMTNGDRGRELISELLRSFSAVYNWDKYKPSLKSIVSLESRELSRFAGQYMWTYQGQDLILEITVAENHLKGIQLWNDFPFEIFPESASRFFDRDGSTLEFSLDDKGGVSGITIFEGSQKYYFKRI